MAQKSGTGGQRGDEVLRRGTSFCDAGKDKSEALLAAATELFVGIALVGKGAEALAVSVGCGVAKTGALELVARVGALALALRVAGWTVAAGPGTVEGRGQAAPVELPVICSLAAVCLSSKPPHMPPEKRLAQQTTAWRRVASPTLARVSSHMILSATVTSLLWGAAGAAAFAGSSLVVAFAKDARRAAKLGAWAGAGIAGAAFADEAAGTGTGAGSGSGTATSATGAAGWFEETEEIACGTSDGTAAAGSGCGCGCGS